MLINELPVHHSIVKRLTDKSFTELTKIQERTILPGLQGKDIIASSKTGSGKTLAFLIPAVHRLLSTKALSRQDPRVLILAPTRELAKQVFLEAKSLCTGQNLACTLVVGGENFNDQVKQLRRNPHIIVGTAGRIADHIKDRSLYINGLELLIFDEADRMLDLGFVNELNLINASADHRKRQTMLFSATMDNVELHHLTKKYLNAPVRVAVGSGSDLHKDIDQSLYFADNVEHKTTLLCHTLANRAYNQAIVFTATREDTDRLADLLVEQGMSAVALRGDLPQNQRANVMSAFSRGQYSILVTTDVASRGLDLRKVELVINYDLPKQADEYVHRIGRTGRAGDKGEAVSFVGPRDWKSFTAIGHNVSYPLACEAHPEHPAEFKGFTPRKTVNKDKKNNKKSASTAGNATKKSTGKKRVHTMKGEDVGVMPVKRKPRKVIDDFDDDE